MDTVLEREMNILQFLPDFKRVASTGGGEWTGPCPHCGGRDRLRLWPEKGTTGRFWCRSCGWSGDGLQMLRDLKGLAFPEALKAWGLTSANTGGRRDTGFAWVPRAAATPGMTWSEPGQSLPRKLSKGFVGIFRGQWPDFASGPGPKS
jgi:DNA primase